MGNKLIKIIYATVLLAVAAVCFIIFFKLVRSGIAKATSTKTSSLEEVVESVVPSEDETISTEPDTPPASVSSADDSWFDEENVGISFIYVFAIDNLSCFIAKNLYNWFPDIWV